VLGGAISQERFLALADPQTGIAEVAGTRVLGVDLSGTEDLVEMERMIDRAVQRMAAQMLLADPLGIDVVIGYLTRKAAEVANIRVIAHARQLGLATDVARQEIAIV
jgi:vacuolar-type H+-ATPase subunit C/Vma6